MIDELLFDLFSQRYERGSTVTTSNLPFDEWIGVLASERLTGALLDRLTHHVHILEMNGASYRLKQSKRRKCTRAANLRGLDQCECQFIEACGMPPGRLQELARIPTRFRA